MIEFENVIKRYDNSEAVHIDRLELKTNRIYGLLGPNGAGKTTTIRMLIGLLKPTSGLIKINQSDVNKTLNYKRDIGYIPDTPNLYENLSGLEFLNFIANLYGYKQNIELKARLEHLTELFDIKEQSKDMISSYSKGMKQKISIISAIIHRPNILILDEPFTGLDPMTIKKLKDYLKEFIKEENKIVLFSTHDLDVASNLCSDVVIIKNGHIILNEQINNLTKDKTLEECFVEVINNEDSD